MQRVTSVAISLVCLASATLAAAQVVPQRVRVSQGVMQGMVVKKVTPQYPDDARTDGIQGSVVLKVIIDKEGNVENIELVSGHPKLAPAAIEAVRQWKYKPFLLNGQAVIVETQVTVNFTLADKAPAEGSPNTSAATTNDTPRVVGGVIGPVAGVVRSSPSSDTADKPKRIRVSSGVASGLLLSKVQPMYPDDARRQQIQGTVLLATTIDTEGNVAHLELISGHPLLAPAAIDAVRQWKYKPYLLNGTPVQVETQIQVNFTLQE